MYHEQSGSYEPGRRRSGEKHTLQQTIRKRILGIDYGTKRIGMARSDPFGNFAQPAGTFRPDTILPAIEHERNAHQIETIVVGYPLNLDGTHSTMTDVVDRFISLLRETFPDLSITTIDEHGSSKQAQKLLVQSGLSRKKRKQKGRLDCAAACLLLQNYLDAVDNPPL